MITETPARELGGVEFQVLEVPLSRNPLFFSSSDRVLFGGDVLFAGGVDRWDLPGGDHDLLFTGIRTKLFPPEDDVRVLPGHGPATTIGHEKTSNPFS
jgi:glyoxylase-like metal-dependent hydrolase (beta-lactamase superfamily II)